MYAHKIKSSVYIAFVLFVLLLTSLKLEAQSTKYSNPKRHQSFYHPFQSPNLWIYGKAYYGFLASHHVEMNNFRDYFPSFEITLSNATYGLSRWQLNTNYPKFGVSYLFSGLGMQKELGVAHALISHINLPIWRKKNLITYFHLGIGLAYLTNKFDPTDNPKNIIIGSNINAAVNLGIEAHYRLNKYHSMSFGASLIHFSNGSIKTPNFGINIPSVQVGFGRLLNHEDKRLAKRKPRKSSFEKNPNNRIEVAAGLILAPKNTDQEFGKSFIVSNFYIDIFKPFNFTHRIGLGADFSYDETDILAIKKYVSDSVNSNRFDRQYIRVGVNSSYELMMYPVVMSFSPGIFIYRKRISNGMLYAKLSLKYYLNKYFYASLSFRNHGLRADYLGLGIGIRTDLFHWE